MFVNGTGLRTSSSALPKYGQLRTPTKVSDVLLDPLQGALLITKTVVSRISGFAKLLRSQVTQDAEPVATQVRHVHTVIIDIAYLMFTPITGDPISMDSLTRRAISYCGK